MHTFKLNRPEEAAYSMGKSKVGAAALKESLKGIRIAGAHPLAIMHEKKSMSSSFAGKDEE